MNGPAQNPPPEAGPPNFPTPSWRSMRFLQALACWLFVASGQRAIRASTPILHVGLVKQTASFRWESRPGEKNKRHIPRGANFSRLLLSKVIFCPCLMFFVGDWLGYLVPTCFLTKGLISISQAIYWFWLCAVF